MPVPPFNHQDALEKTNLHIHMSDKRRRLMLIIVCVALLFDNMLYLAILPIIPDYLRSIFVEYITDTSVLGPKPFPNGTFPSVTFTQKFHPPVPQYRNERTSVGVLFASKAIVQVLVCPISGIVMDRIGYDLPMVFGLGVNFISTMVFAFGGSYWVLFVARSLQGLGSAFADTSGLAMIADSYTEEEGRGKALGIALAFISFGSAFAAPFGGFLYEFAGKRVPFSVLATILLVDGFLLMLVTNPVRLERSRLKREGSLPRGTPIYKLILDPYIAICAGALVMANVGFAFLEPTMAVWMRDTMNVAEWQIGLVWFPAFFPLVLGIFTTVTLCYKYPTYHWLFIAVGLCFEGLSYLIIPFCKTYTTVIIPIMIDCFGIALVVAAVLPTLSYLVDIRHVSVYGSVYAIANMGYSLAYAFGPIFAGGIVASVGFMWLNIGIFISNILYSPIVLLLRKVYNSKPVENAPLMMDTKSSTYKSYEMDLDHLSPTDSNDTR